MTNTLFVCLENLKVAEISNYSNFDKLILLLAGAFHDLDHPGNNNLFEINTKSVLALTYNDKSVLENYHLFLFFNFLNNDNMNIFSCFELHEIKNIRRMFINMIVGTDVTNHRLDLKKLNDVFNDHEFDPKKQETKEFIMVELLHFADISNCAKPFNIYRKWVDKLFTEFYIQVLI